MQILDDMSGALTAPFVGELDLIHLFLLVGVIIAFIIVWSMILGYMRAAITEVVT